MNNEIWQPINKLEIDYTGYYEISNLGRVKSLKRIIYRNGSKAILKEKIIKWRNGKKKNTYPMVYLCKNNITESKKVSRLVAIHFIPNTENLPCVGHRDNDKNNSNMSNLYWCTHKTNTQDAWKTGRMENVRNIYHNHSGINNPNNKLTETQVKEIRQSNLSIKQLSLNYNVNIETIRHIIKRIIWNNI